jgi:hypothetical protein
LGFCGLLVRVLVLEVLAGLDLAFLMGAIFPEEAASGMADVTADVAVVADANGRECSRSPA